MTLSRQNLALIGVGGAVVVLGVGIVLANLKISKDVDEALIQRSKLSRDLRNLDGPVRLEDGSSSRINADIVDMEEERVRAVRESLSEVVNECTKWNKERFTVLSTTVRGRVIKAFPVDRDAFDRYQGTLPWNLTQTYINEINSLLDPLLPAIEVEQDEIDQETPLWIERLRVSPEFRSLGADGEEIIREAAAQEARDSLVARNIQGRLIYATPEALHPLFDRPTAEASIDAIWRAQVSLWVTQDILEAIRRTNAKVVEGLENPTVIDSAVKRLIGIHVAGYATEEYAERVTGRISSPEYDVLTYNFEVIMPLRYIELLQRELMSLNYHTILNVSTAAAYVAPNGGFEYGPDSVVTATIDGELLLLTTWERGTWDDESSPPGWSRELPPLMPQEMLDQLPAQALRGVDNNPRD